MSGFELNKIAASILLASLITMIVGSIANVLYKPDLTMKQRGYIVQTHGMGEVSNDNEPQANEELLDIASLMSQANANAGEKIIKKCIACHSMEENGPNKVGPNLWNIINAKKAHSDKYNYSSALASKGGNWTYEELFHFFKNPRKFAPGTKMSFAGIKDPQDIADLIEFLRQKYHAPKPELP